jgi:hypothetical protein
VKNSYAIALMTFVTLGAGSAFANEAAAPAAAPAAGAYRDAAPSIDCRRAPGRALALLRETMNPCNRDGIPPRAPKASAAARVAEGARPAQSPVTAAPPEAQSAPARVDRSDCPQTAGEPQKRPRHLLFLHLT